MSKKPALTPAAIHALKTGLMADPQTPGLYVEALASGKKVWRYRRRLTGQTRTHEARLGLFPRVGTDDGFTVAAARDWARKLNDAIDAGRDPREEERQAKAAAITVDAAHAIYIEAVRRGEHRTRRSKSAKPDAKERTVKDKLGYYERNIRPAIGTKAIGDVTQDDLIAIIGKVRERGGVQANRTSGELNVFFGWAASLRGKAAGLTLTGNPASVLKELWVPENTRDRWLDHDELPVFLKALASEERQHRRVLLLWLLTGARYAELVEAKASEFRDGTWTIPSSRSKNGDEHPIRLAPWGRSLIATNSEWVVPSPRAFYADRPMRSGWPKVIERVRKRMEELSGKKVARFTIHDLRRTMRSHLEDHDIDEALAERMVNHKLSGLRKIYNRNKRAAAMEVGFAAWENALIRLAEAAGVAQGLDCPERK